MELSRTVITLPRSNLKKIFTTSDMERFFLQEKMHRLTRVSAPTEIRKLMIQITFRIKELESNVT